MAATKAPRRPRAPRGATPEKESFERRWGPNRFANPNIARDLEPHEREQMLREKKELGP